MWIVRNFLDPLAALIGSMVILSWAVTLIQDTNTNLLDINPDRALTDALRKQLDKDGSVVTDLHVTETSWCDYFGSYKKSMSIRRVIISRKSKDSTLCHVSQLS
jgi:Co/Zn/Cd efflux system component